MDNKKKEIHERALVAAKEFKRSEANLIRILQEVEESKLFLDFNLTSMYQYALKKLGLSENTACNFIAVARKASQVPLLQAAIEDGSVSVSNARKVTSIVTPKNQEEWVDKLKNLSQKKLEQEVAKANPKEANPESAKYVSENRLQLKMGISEEVHAEFKKVQDLESKRNFKAVSLEETLQALIKVYLDVKDPLKRANRILPVLRQANPAVNSSKSVPAVRKHQVAARDQGQCTYVAEGMRCESRRWTEVHHVLPRSEGGDHSLENLTTLCSVHHKLIHLNRAS